MIDLAKLIRCGEMSKSFYEGLSRELKETPPKNSRMRFRLSACYEGDIFEPQTANSLTITEYADVCEGETQTAKSVICENASEVIDKCGISIENKSVAFIQDELKEIFESLELFRFFCAENGIEFIEQPLWVDEHSFNEYIGEHRGEYAPFASKRKKSED